MRVVVTGAAGFIGSHVAHTMATAGHEILAVDRRGHKGTTDPGIRWASLDLAEAETEIKAEAGTKPENETGAQLSQVLAGSDVVIHLAGRPGVRTSWDDPATWRDNVEATRRLLAACRELPASERPRVILASSSSVYGSARRPCDEDDELHPESPYGHAKMLAEQLTRRAGLHAVILRFFSVYGPRQRPDMAFHRFFEAALAGRPLPVFGDGSQSRAFTFVDDVVAATVAAATTDLPPGIAVNVGHPVTVPVGEALRRIVALVGASDPAVTRTAPARGDVTRTWAATARAERLLGWTARTDLDEGLKRQLEWHRHA